MAKKNSLKNALITSALSLVLCSSALVGTTYAWFTDSVTSNSNVIQTGTLKVDLELLENGSWTSIKESKKAIFDNKKWEPGYVEVKTLKIENEGSLALKYKLAIVPNGEVSSLADVIDVYILDGQQEVTRDMLASLTPVGTLRDLINDPSGVDSDYLADESEKVITIALKMREEAGNEYQDMSIGTFSVQLLATQYTYEEDSIDKKYDINTPWIGIIPESLEDTTLEIVPGDSSENRGTITVNSAEDLVYLPKLAAEWVSLYSNGQGTSVSYYYEKNGGKGAAYYYTWGWTVELGADLDMNNLPMDPIALTYWGNFDGNGHSISNVVVDCPETGYAGLFSVTSGPVKDLNVNNVKVLGTEMNDNVGAVVGYCRSSMDNVHVTNATISGNKYVGSVAGKVESGIANSSATNVTVTATGKTVGGLVGYTLGDTTNNTVENATVSGAYNVGGLLGQAQNKTVEGNTVKDVYLTSNALIPTTADATEVRTGAVVARNYNATIGTNTIINVNEAQPATPEDIQAKIDAAASGDTIYLASAKFHTTIKMKRGITLIGTNGTVVDCINLNGAESVTLKNITFDAAGAQWGCDGNGNRKQRANIITSDGSLKIGARNLLIEGCTFTGTFANGGAAIAFPDQSRTSGQSGNITIKGCTFETTGGYYDIYTYYSGYGTLNIEGNTFASEVLALPIYLGRYQSSTPVVVKGNAFEKCESFDDAAAIQDHSSYGVSFDAADNTFGG